MRARATQELMQFMKMCLKHQINNPEGPNPETVEPTASAAISEERNYTSLEEFNAPETYWGDYEVV